MPGHRQSVPGVNLMEAVPGHCRDTAVLKKALDSVLAPEHVRDRARYRGVPSEPAAVAVRPDVKFDHQRRVHRPATAILRRCRFAALAVDVGAALTLPHRVGPPLGYGKRRTDDGKEAFQA